MTRCYEIEVAKRCGLLEAVILWHIDYWLRKNAANRKHIHDGKVWTYNSTKAFQELFPEITYAQIKHALTKLRNDGYVECANYNTDKFNRSNWYTLTDKYWDIDGILPIDWSNLANAKDENEQCNNTTIINTNKETTNSLNAKGRKQHTNLDLTIVNPELIEPMKLWLDYKKERGQGYKEIGFKQCYAKLVKFSGGNHDVAMRIIEEAISNNYSGFFQIKNNATEVIKSEQPRENQQRKRNYNFTFDDLEQQQKVERDYEEAIF